MCGNYSREETIQGRKLYEEIRYINFHRDRIEKSWIVYVSIWKLRLISFLPFTISQIKKKKIVTEDFFVSINSKAL